jgi:hypothetical protein
MRKPLASDGGGLLTFAIWQPKVCENENASYRSQNDDCQGKAWIMTKSSRILFKNPSR